MVSKIAAWRSDFHRRRVALAVVALFVLLHARQDSSLKVFLIVVILVLMEIVGLKRRMIYRIEYNQ
jgi:hypothetical protein